MKNQSILILLEEEYNKPWDTVCHAFNGKVLRKKIDSFKSDYGIVLYFYNEEIVKYLQEQFPLYYVNFPIWA